VADSRELAVTDQGMGVPKWATKALIGGPRSLGFPKPNPVTRFKIQNNALLYLQNSRKIVGGWSRPRGTTSLFGQTSKLQQILNYKFRKDLEFYLIWILNGFKPFGRNPRNSPKLYHGIAYTNIIFDDALVYEISMFLYKWYLAYLEKIWDIWNLNLELDLGLVVKSL
jgi:hypothetical protein